MVNKCAVSYCSTGKPVSNDVSDEKRKSVSTFHFPVNNDLLTEKWVYFVNKKEWTPSKNSVICERHFEEKYIKQGEKRSHLLYDLNPIPTIHTDEANGIPASVLRVPTVPRTVPTERNVAIDEKPMFKEMDKISSLEDLTPEVSPPGFTFEKHRGKVVYYNKHNDYVTSVPQIFETIVVDEKLHVNLSYKGNHIPLPNFLRDNHCILNKFSILENLPAYIRAKASEANSVLEELNEIKHFAPKGRPVYSANII